MTDQPKPDRQNGDGLSREQIIEYIRELNTIAAECEIAGTAELTRAAHNLYRIARQWFKSLPTRDAAEGVGFPIGEDTPYWRTLRAALVLPVEEQFAIAKDLAANCGYELTGDDYSAPPKPAPDAMREALRNLIDWVKSVEQPLAECHFTEVISCPREQITKAESALSATVPPADGGVPVSHSKAIALLMHSRRQTIAKFDLYNGSREELQAVIDRANASPSGTGAAEPVAQPFAWTIPSDDQADCNGFIPTKVSREGEFTKPLYATPPVRGGREEGIVWRRVNDEAFEYAIQEGPHGDEFVKLVNGSCLRRPVQPGAGERDVLTEIGKALEARAADYRHRGGMLFSGFTIADELDEYSTRALSRQAPPSTSSEGGR